jgi:hypothetical protein
MGGVLLPEDQIRRLKSMKTIEGECLLYELQDWLAEHMHDDGLIDWPIEFRIGVGDGVSTKDLSVGCINGVVMDRGDGVVPETAEQTA